MPDIEYGSDIDITRPALLGEPDLAPEAGKPAPLAVSIRTQPAASPNLTAILDFQHALRLAQRPRQLAQSTRSRAPQRR